MSKAGGALKAQVVKLIVPAGKATPSPPVGPAMGARGVKAIDFCKEFNARTSHFKADLPIPTTVNIQPDRTFTMSIRTPPVTYFLKKAAGIDLGTGNPGSSATKGSVTLKHIYQIAKIKCTDEHLKVYGEEAVAKQIIGSARTLGLEVLP